MISLSQYDCLDSSGVNHEVISCCVLIDMMYTFCKIIKTEHTVERRSLVRFM